MFGCSEQANRRNSSIGTQKNHSYLLQVRENKTRKERSLRATKGTTQMFLFSNWTEQDGVHECILSYFYAADPVPILRVRAVRDGEGCYKPVIREYTGRGTQIFRGWPKLTIEEAKEQAKRNAQELLLSDIKEMVSGERERNDP